MWLIQLKINPEKMSSRRMQKKKGWRWQTADGLWGIQMEEVRIERLVICSREERVMAQGRGPWQGQSCQGRRECVAALLTVQEIRFLLPLTEPENARQNLLALDIQCALWNSARTLCTHWLRWPKNSSPKTRMRYKPLRWQKKPLVMSNRALI